MNDRRQSIFDGVSQRPITIRGVPTRSPLFYRDLSMMQAIYLADATAARRWMPSPRLQPLIAPAIAARGRALVAINCFEYRETDIGPYNEVGVSVAVLPPSGSSGSWRAAVDALRRTLHGHVLELPVNTEIALHGGVDFFGYPKFVADIRFSEVGDTLRCEVTDRDTGAPILRTCGTRLGARRRGARPRPWTNVTYPLKDRQLLRARLLVDEIECSRTRLGSGFTIELGAHPRSESLADLRLGPLIAYRFAPRCQAILYEPNPI